MTVHLNRAAATHARLLIEGGKVDKASAWSFEAADGEALLGSGGNNWVEYARWFLGEDTAAAPKTKERFKYPVGKDGKIYRAALIAIRQRAGQQGNQAVFDEAGNLVDLIDGKSNAASPFEIRAQGTEQPAEVYVYGDIGDSWDENGVLAAQFVRDLQNVEASAINVRINSYGGRVSDGLAIYNALQRHPATVNTFVDGVAISCASLIAMAGKSLTMAENAVMMVHGPMAMAGGNAQDLRAAADVLDKYAQAMAPAYAAKTGKPVADMLALLTDGEDHWFTANEARDMGFVDDVSAAAVVEARFDLTGRFRSVPAAAAAFTMERKGPMPDMTPAGTPSQPAQPAAAVPAAAPAAGAPAAAPALAVVQANGRGREENLEIRTAFAPFLQVEGVRALYEDTLVDPAVTVEQARAKLLKKIGENATPATPSGLHVEMGASERDKFRAACGDAILVRAGGGLASKEVRAEIGQNPYRGHKLLDIARASLERAGVKTVGMSQMDVVASAFTQTGSDFPILLENVMHKALQMAYGTTPNTWKQFCAIGSVSDFRASNRYRLGSFTNLDALTEAGEFKNKTITDGEKASITASTKGNIINLSRQAIINDDLGAFVGLAAGLGRAANRTVEVDVYAQLALNSNLGPTMSDTHPLFDAAHGNISATGAISVSVFDDARVKMASQKDVSGNDYLDLRPQVLLIPIASGGDARVINGSQYDTSVSNKFQVPNKVYGLFKEVVDSPRLSGTRFYIFADPTIAPTLEVAFLDGNQEPYIELQQGFTVDGAQYKVRLDYGVAVIDYRGAVTGAGA